MMDDPLFLIAGFATLVVAAILLFGIGSFAKGGEFNRRNANKIMRWRLMAQFVAVLLLVAFAWIRGSGG